MKRPTEPYSFIFDLTALQWRHYGFAGFAFLGGVWCFVVSIILTYHGSEETLAYSHAGLIFVFFGAAFAGLGKLANQSRKNIRELTVQLETQEDRIRQLEAQVAALTTQRTTPN